jgi:putative aldouronate transport system permease protein
MVIKKTIGDYIFDCFNYALLFALSVMTLYPFLYVFFASLSSGTLLTQHAGILLSPLGTNLDSYRFVLMNPLISSGYRNTIFIVVVGTLANVISTSIAAYVMSRKDFYWKKLLMGFIFFTMFFGGGLIPSYLLIRSLGMLGSFSALIIPGLISTYNMIIMRTAFQEIPDELIESSRLDGANEFLILFRIVLPLSMPTIAVMLLRFGVGHWNSWFGALIYVGSDRGMWPLQLVLRQILIENDTSEMMAGVLEDRAELSATIKYATIMVATIPVLMIYPFLQRYFTKGVMIGSLKG